VTETVWDVVVVGCGPTGLAVGAEARRAGLSAVLVDKGALTANLLEFPTYMRFFTTRDRLEIGGVPFAVPDEKPDRQQALVYYRAVVRHHGLTVRTYEEVSHVERAGEHLVVHTRSARGADSLRGRSVVVATGYFGHPRRLGVPGEDLPWVHERYREPYPHFDEHVAIIGGGNSACEAALELWRNDARVTVIHRGSEIKPTVKYWVKPDFENRVAEGSINALMETTVEAFAAGEVVARKGGEPVRLGVDAAYVLIGYTIDADMLRRSGVEVTADELIPTFDEQTGETNVPGLYVAGAVRSGIHTNRIFIDNSREHGAAIVADITARLRKAGS
jgi:thioredoxin reductase (NADPH)